MEFVKSDARSWPVRMNNDYSRRPIFELDKIHREPLTEHFSHTVYPDVPT